MTSNDWWTGGGAGDSNQNPWALNIVPKTPVPEPQDIPIRIEIGVTSRVRQFDEAFKPTITYTESFIYHSDLLHYTTLVPTIVSFIWSYVQSEKMAGAIVQTHVAIWLDNVTHPWTGAGVVKLPKGHRDTQLSNEEFTSAQILQDHLTGNILDVKNGAKY